MRAKPGYISDQESAEKFDYKMQKLLWAFACANNCVNPLLYKMMGQKSKWASILPYGKKVKFHIFLRTPRSSTTLAGAGVRPSITFSQSRLEKLSFNSPRQKSKYWLASKNVLALFWRPDLDFWTSRKILKKIKMFLVLTSAVAN